MLARTSRYTDCIVAEITQSKQECLRKKKRLRDSKKFIRSGSKEKVY